VLVEALVVTGAASEPAFVAERDHRFRHRGDVDAAMAVIRCP
jgi:hypothetical protein